jgi:hypothetical protein
MKARLPLGQSEEPVQPQNGDGDSPEVEKSRQSRRQPGRREQRGHGHYFLHRFEGESAVQSARVKNQEILRVYFPITRCYRE